MVYDFSSTALKIIVMPEYYEIMIHDTYEAFNARNIDKVLAYMDPDVQWPNGWEGGYVYGHEGIRDYWTRQWKEIDPVVTPVTVTENGKGEIEVEVQQLAKDMQGNVLFNGLVKHIYTIKGGLIKRMEIEKA
jgi:hypothetical protein